MRYDIPSGARHILQTLNAAGYEAYLVGGCTRDLLRAQVPSDWDICTSALPEQTKACFPGQRIIETGLKHGTVTVMDSGEGYEVTTFRADAGYSDGRRPDRVCFIKNLKEDLARRDFTMNAIALDIHGEIYDPFGGVEDISNGVVRCVGNPDVRFQEDGLRVMRAIRFACVFGFTIEPDTARSVHRNRAMLAHVAAERINTELCKLLVGQNAGAILGEYLDVLCEFWPELGTMAGVEQHNPWHCHDVWEHTLAAVEAAPRDLVLRLTMLMHDIGKPSCRTTGEDGVDHFYKHAAVSTQLANEMLRRLKFDHDTIEQVAELVAHHDAELAPRGRVLRRWLHKIGEERLFQLLEVKRADNMGQHPDMVKERLAELEEIKRKTRLILEEKQCFALKDLEIDGQDVLAAGVEPGAMVGRVLNAILDQVISGEIKNERAVLLEKILPTSALL